MPTSTPVNKASLTVLVADDDVTNRLLLSAILRKEGYAVIQAEDGREAVEVFERERPDLVLMDIRMPELDGYQATEQIKAMSGDVFVPVIFLTANSDVESMVKSVEAGGDDFLAKPYNRIQLQARINALMRIRELYSTVHHQRNELILHQKRLERERQLAKRLFTNIVHTGALDHPNIKYLLSPMSLFSGDILLAAPKPSGGLHVMLGDFTGHGLAAATGALPVSSIFYGMTAKGYSIAEIVAEINSRLTKILPVDMFLAACLVDVDTTTHTLTVWNGGLPPLLVYDAAQRTVSQRLASQHLPLGIMTGDSFSRRMSVVRIHEGDRFYICSDGVLETQNLQGDMFGEARFNALFEARQAPQDLFESILDRLSDFQAGGSQRDDVTLLEVCYDQTQLGERGGGLDNRRSEGTGSLGRMSTLPAAWRLQLCLSADILKSMDPLPLLIQALMDLQGFRGQRQQLYTVFSELYSNALEHGLLGLSSSLKASASGFAEYYQSREEGLMQLRDGELNIDVRHEPEGEGGKLTVTIEDTGAGFDYTATLPSLADNLAHSGRGIQLLRSICDEVNFQGNGNRVQVIYRWQ